MTIQYASDLHLEMVDNKKYLEANPLIKSGDILILAGDIIYMHPTYYDMQVFDQWSKMYDKVYMIPGNHEFYKRSFPISGVLPAFNLKIRDNVFLVNNISEEINGFSFIFSTLFTRLDPIRTLEIGRTLGDFSQSKYDEKSHRFTVDQYQQCHTKSRAFVETELENLRDSPAVLISHHVPYSSKLIPDYPFTHDSILNSAFHVDLSYMMKKFNIAYCISGHSHVNHDPIKIHDTICMTNQLGYVGWSEHYKFNKKATFDI